MLSPYLIYEHICTNIIHIRDLHILQYDGRPPKLSEKIVKIRVSVTLTKPYLEALDRLVKEGIYLSQGEIIMEALRRIFRSYGMEQFSMKGAGLTEDTEK